MKNIVVGRMCCGRPAMLKLSLDFQKNSVDSELVKTIFFVDKSHNSVQDSQVESVAKEFNLDKEIILREKPYGYFKNWFESLKYIFGNCEADCAVMIEDDCIFSYDIFVLIKYICDNFMSSDNIFGFHGGYLTCTLDNKMSNLLGVSTGLQTILCGVFREHFYKYVDKIATEDLYMNRGKYFDSIFDKNIVWKYFENEEDFKLRRDHMGYDVFIACVANQNNFNFIYPIRRRSSHIGIHGVHLDCTNEFKSKNFLEQYQLLKKACLSGAELKKLSLDLSNYTLVDFDPVVSIYDKFIMS